MDLLNYQCAHIFGWTKNPLLFEAIWNICFSPKIFDPLTGHEARGHWPMQYQNELYKVVCSRFQSLILDYDRFILEHHISAQIDAFIDRVRSEYEPQLLRKFQLDAHQEWSELPIRR